jgi:hypothetical protein
VRWRVTSVLKRGRASWRQCRFPRSECGGSFAGGGVDTLMIARLRWSDSIAEITNTVWYPNAVPASNPLVDP